MRRKNGEGSWGTKTIKGETYKYFKIEYDGKMKYFYGKTNKEINQKRKDFESSIEKQKVFTANLPKVTFGEYLEKYLKIELSKTLTPNGYDSYETIIKTQIKNLKEYDLYNKQINQLSTDVFKAYINALIEHGYALKTIKKVGGLISQCLKYGVLRKDLPTNYMDSVKYPTEVMVKKKKKEHLFFSKEQMEKFCEAALHKESSTSRCNHRIPIGNYTYANNGVALAIIGQSGLRVGELIALRWNNIHFDKKLIEVVASESLVKERDINGEVIVIKDKNGSETQKKIRYRKTTKTAAGIRFIPMTNLTYDLFRYFEQFKTSDNSTVCVNMNGNPLNKDNLRRTLITICENNNLPILTTHELRHSYGSIILHQEHVDIQVVSKLLGHKDISTTYNIYSHVLSEIMAQSVNIFNTKYPKTQKEQE